MTNRDRPASTMTKREKAAERYAAILLAADPDRDLDDLTAHAVAAADSLYDELDTPTELRGELFAAAEAWNHSISRALSRSGQEDTE